ncbi:MAG TPA: Mur ligase family protein [Candidatus Paceibacterota bacterium]|nr:Mur ligase family protein [Candidatus Paceibacterota bacterium]
MIKDLLRSLVIRLLEREARAALLRHTPFVIAVTGSVGKTTTKDLIAAVLEKSTRLRKSMKSFNSEIGLPLSVLGLPNAWSSPIGWIKNLWLGFKASRGGEFPETLVLEIGADHPGDIGHAMSWIAPDIAVVTRLPERPVHVEFFSSPEEVREEKAKLVVGLKDNGVFVGNGDDAAVLGLRTRTKARMITYGMREGVMMRSPSAEILYEIDPETKRRVPVGMGFRIDWSGGSYPIRLYGVVGEQGVMAALAALAVGVARNTHMLDMIDALGAFSFPPGRMRLIPGKNHSILIDDTYNASPVAMAEAIETLARVDVAGPAGPSRRIAVLGDMLELGKYSEEEHRKIGKLLALRRIDMLVAVGKRAAWIAEAAREEGMLRGAIYHCMDSVEAGEWLAARVETGDAILLKGSQGSGPDLIRMERATRKLMNDPGRAHELLVRQEDEWQTH